MASRRGTKHRASPLISALTAIALMFGIMTSTATADLFKEAVRYHGGPVQHHPHVYVIFWGSKWNQSANKGPREHIEKFFQTVSGSAWQGILTQYFDETGTISSEVGFTPYIDTSVVTPPENAVPQDAYDINQNLVAEAVKVIEANNWPHGPDDQFMVVFPNISGITNCGGAHTTHGSALGNLRISFVEQGFCEHPEGTASHEYAETVTSPGGSANVSWITNEIGIAGLAGPEIADNCPNGVLPNGLVVSKLYDNHLHECALSDPEPPRVYASSEEATSVTATSAVLHGVVNPVGKDTSYHFEIGSTTAYGTRFPAEDVAVGSGWGNVVVDMPVNELDPGSTYHFRVVATNSTGTNAGEDLEFTTPMDSDSTIPAQLEGMPVTEPFDQSPASQTEFSTEWSALGWATGSEPKGEVGTVYPIGLSGSRYGWVPTEPAPAVNGAYYDASASDGGGGLATVATMAGRLFSGNHFSLWLDMPTPDARGGYELRADQRFDDLYSLTLCKWSEGKRTELTSWSSSRSNPPDGSSFALVDHKDTVSAWIDTGTGFSRVLFANDDAFDSGYAGLEAEANTGHISERFYVLNNFKVGTLKQLPTATADAATGVSGTAATLNGRVNPEGLKTSYRFEYDEAEYKGKEPHGTSVPIPDETIGSGTNDVAVSRAIEGLKPGNTYHYRVVANNEAGTTYSKDKTLTTYGPPKVTTVAATEVKGTSATLNATINPENSATSYRLEYDTSEYKEGEKASHGTSVPVPDEAIGSGTSNVAVSQQIKGLEAGRNYHFRVVASNANGTSYGKDLWLKPAATTAAATNVETVEATLNGTVNPHGASTKYRFEYDTSAYETGDEAGHGTVVPKSGVSTGSGTNDIAVSQQVEGLEPQRTYHYRVVAEYESGASAFGKDQAFTTPAVPETTLCKASPAESGCGVESRYPAKTTIGAELPKQLLFTTSQGNVECGSHLKASSGSQSGAPLALDIEELSFSNCGSGSGSCTVGPYEKWAGSLTWTDGANGKIRYKEPRINIHCGSFINCNYYFPSLILKGGNPAQLAVNEATLIKASGFLCPSASTIKAATYTVSEPQPLYVAKAAVQPPDTTIAAGSSGMITPDASFSFTSSESGSSFECSLDGGSYDACTSPKTYQGLAEGFHAFRVRAVGSGGADPSPAERSLNVIETAKALSSTAVLDDFGRYENPLKNGNWTKTGWAEAIGASWTGSWHGYGGWDSTPLAGAYWNPRTFSDANGGLIVAATLGSGPRFAGEYLSLWLDMPNPGSDRSGYEARFTGVDGSSNYKVELSKWVSGERKVLGTKEGFSLPVNTTFAMTESGGALTLWTGTSSFSPVISATDSTYSSGYAGLEAHKGEGTAYNFRAGMLLKPPKATTEAATEVKANSATLNGVVNPEGSATSYYFEYGKTTAYGTKVPASPKSAGSGSSNIAVSEALGGLEAGTTYHFQVVAEGAGVPVPGGDKEFTTPNTAAEINVLPTLDALNRSESPLSNGGKWSALAWDTSTSGHNTGTDTGIGWGPYDSNPTVNGAYWNPSTFSDKTGDAAAITMQVEPGVEKRYLALWLDMGNPGSSKSGYQLRWIRNGGGTYTVKLSKWSGGKETELASNASVTIAIGTTMAISDTGGTVTAWETTGGSLTSILSASDTAFSEGYAGIEGVGASRSKNFKAGRLLGGAITGVSVLDDFGREESPLATGKWTTTGWAEEIGNSWSGGWHGYGARDSHLAGAYWNPTTFSDASGALVVAATLGTGPRYAPDYLSLWLNMPSPDSTRSGYEARFTGTNGSPSAYKVELSKWVSGARTVLAIKEGFSLPIGTTMALTETAGALTLWTGTSSFSPVLSATDSTYSSGYAGLEANMGEGTEYDFRAGGL